MQRLFEQYLSTAFAVHVSTHCPANLVECIGSASFNKTSANSLLLRNSTTPRYLTNSKLNVLNMRITLVHVAVFCLSAGIAPAFPKTSVFPRDSSAAQIDQNLTNGCSASQVSCYNKQKWVYSYRLWVEVINAYLPCGKIGRLQYRRLQMHVRQFE